MTGNAQRGMICVQMACAAVVGQVLSGKNLDRVLDAQLSAMTGLDAGDRGAIRSISFDTLRHYGLLSAQIDILLSQPAADAPVRHLLLVALSQLQFSRAASHAIVDHAVEAVSMMGFPRAKSLTNAVLRTFLRTPEKFRRQRFKTTVARYDFPRWWLARSKAEYPENWEAILLSAREHPPMWLRVNLRRTRTEDYLRLLGERGIAVKLALGAAIQLETPCGVQDLPGFAEGQVSVQDLGAQLAALILAPEPGMRTLDACAAPGGKAGQLLERFDTALTALDNDSARLQRVALNLRRLGMAADLYCSDAALTANWWDGKPFDRILLDVPCSGSGVVRRHPDIKWIRRESDIAGFVRQQSGLLESLWQCLGIGGRLLYATCSIFHAENSGVIEQFLLHRTDARRLPIGNGAANEFKHPGDIKTPTLQCTNGQLLPDQVHDGFFYALLEKTA